MKLSIFEISLLLVGTMLAGALFQWPIGSLSDRYDRRIIIIGCCLFLLLQFYLLSLLLSFGYNCCSYFAVAGASWNDTNLFVETTVSFNYFWAWCSTTMDKTSFKLFLFRLTKRKYEII